MTTLPSTPVNWSDFARRVIECVVRGSDPGTAGSLPAADRPHGGVFVTLHLRQRLRGCMGTLDAQMPLGEAVRQAAVCAAAEDPRFSPVEPHELPELRIEVSILSEPRPMADLAELEIGRHGILVRRGAQRGLFLPQVAVEHKLDKETFLARCCTEKAGLPPDAWKDPKTEVLLFTAEVIGESPGGGAAGSNS